MYSSYNLLAVLPKVLLDEHGAHSHAEIVVDVLHADAPPGGLLRAAQQEVAKDATSTAEALVQVGGTVLHDAPDEVICHGSKYIM